MDFIEFDFIRKFRIRRVIVGRSFFSRPRGDYDKNHDLGDGLELWDGIFQSCVLGWKTSYLNVDG